VSGDFGVSFIFCWFSGINKEMQPLEKTIIGKPERWLIDAAASIGLNYSELSHETTNYFVSHVRN
jgi:hypothetical protein